MKGSEAFPRNWLAESRTIPIAEIAARLGCEVRRDAFGPCPACGAERRGSTDTRPPIRFGAGGWHCFRCGISGDGIALASLALFGRILTRGDPAWPELRRWFDSRGGVGGYPHLGPANVTAQAERVLPAADEVAALWGSCRFVDEVKRVVSWLRQRGIDEVVVRQRDLARALRPTAPMPRWAWTRRGTWHESGHSLLLPAWSPEGGLASVHARLPEDPKDRNVQKGLQPTGCSASNLILANGVAIAMLHAGRNGARGTVTRVLIVEGVPDYLSWATQLREDGSEPWAVFGIWAGGWTRHFAERIPDRAEVTVRVHNDEAGNRYFANVRSTLLGRDVTLLRAVGGCEDGS